MAQTPKHLGDGALTNTTLTTIHTATTYPVWLGRLTMQSLASSTDTVYVYVFINWDATNDRQVAQAQIAPGEPFVCDLQGHLLEVNDILKVQMGSGTATVHYGADGVEEQ